MNKRTNQQIVAERSFAAGASIRDAEVAELRQQVTLLRSSLLASANYIDTLGGTSLEARRTLAATEQGR